VAKKVYVTRVQRDAAKLLVDRSATTGRYVSPNVRKIANAQPVATRSGDTHSRATAKNKSA
jgi:hypothetical protein